MIKTQYDMKVKILCFDNDGEYMSNDFFHNRMESLNKWFDWVFIAGSMESLNEIFIY